MNQDEPVKALELDQLVGGPRLNMLKAALPYVPSHGQKMLSVLIKAGELNNTLQLAQNADEGLGICSLEGGEATPLDMLHAIKPYGTPSEQEFLDLVENFMEGTRLSQAYQETAGSSQQDNGGGHKMAVFDMLKMMLPPQQTEKFEMYQMLMQTFQQGL